MTSIYCRSLDKKSVVYIYINLLRNFMSAVDFSTRLLFAAVFILLLSGIVLLSVYIDHQQIHAIMLVPPVVIGLVVSILYSRYLTMYRKLKETLLEIEANNNELEKSITEKEQELQHQQNALSQAQKSEALGRLAGGISHDFNNILTAIIGNAYLIAEDSKNPSIKTSANEIIHLSEQATDLTSQMLTISQKNVMQFKDVDIPDFIHDTCKTLNRLLGENHSLKELHVDRNVEARVDVIQLRQAIINLVINAKEAMPWGGSIEIVTRKVVKDSRDEFAEIAIIDHGVGINEELQKKIFEPFFSTKQGDESTGLGLAVVKGVIDKHQGEIYYETQDGKGTVFKIHVPSAQHKQKIVESVKPVNKPLKACADMKILVIEDEKPVRELLTKLLKQIDCHVLAIADSREVDQAGGVGVFDLLITDVVLPGASGPEMAQFLVKKRLVNEVLYISGYPGKHLELLQDKVEDANFLAKPFTPATFYKTLGQYCHMESD